MPFDWGFDSSDRTDHVHYDESGRGNSYIPTEESEEQDLFGFLGIGFSFRF